MITPRTTRLLRAADLQAFQRAILSAIPDGSAARATAVIVSARSAAETLRRTLEDRVLREAAVDAVVVPDLLTRDELYVRLHEGLPDTPPLLSEFDREVLLRLAAADAEAEGAPPPFRLRPGLLAAMLAFYDELRRRGRSLDSFDRAIRERLESSRDTDRGAARLLEQTRFLAATFAAFERRAGDSGRIDEHALRALLLSSTRAPMYSHVVVCVPDQAAGARGLWPADFDLFSRLHGLERLDIVATERVLATGFHQRLHDALPGIEEERVQANGSAPVLLVPEPARGAEPEPFFLSRDREEELADAVRAIKARARAVDRPTPLDRTAVVFRRPLPYLYLARHVFGAARMPYEAMDALPLAAEPYAAAVDLIFVALSEEGTRTSLVELLASPHWRVDAEGGGALSHASSRAFDRILKDERYHGGWARLHQLAASGAPARGGRAGDLWRQAAPAFAAASAAARDLETIATAPTAVAQLDALLAFITTREHVPHAAEPAHARHLRARAAVLGAIASLREAHARYDDRPLPIADLVGTLRRWIEGQTFAPRTGDGGVRLLDAEAAAFADVDDVRIVGLVESDWPERMSPGIFYPASLLRDLGWPPEQERLAAARAGFLDLLTLGSARVAVSTFSLEDDALVQPSPLLEDVPSLGLPLDRVPSSSCRIFTHEALFSRPVPAEGVPAAAGAWLDLRRSRTESGDARYRGTVGPRAPAVYAVSSVERYLECPFKYFAGTVLRLDEEREDESGLTPQERGQLLHGVFEAFFQVWQARGGLSITLDNLEQAVALFDEIAEHELLEVPEGDRALERTYLLGSAAAPGLAERAFAFEIEQGIPVLERLVEHAFEGTFRFEGPDGARAVRLRGKADRIDLLSDGSLRIVDYKLGRAPKPGRALQLPVYGVCARQDLDGRLGRSWTLGKAGYVAFRERNAFVELGGARGGNLGSALQEGQERFLAAVDRIEAGEFPASPDEAWTCTRCGFPDVCRKDYVGDE